MSTKNSKIWLFLKKWHVPILLLAIVLIGAYLRLSHFNELARFNADQVRDTKIVTQMIQEHQFPLLGPKAGGTTFRLGPAFYYLQYLSGNIFGATPAGIAIIVPLLSILSIIALFYLLRFYFTEHFSLLLTFLYATSFYAIRYSRFAWNPNLIPFFLFIYLIALLQILQKKSSLFWYVIAGISMGIGIQLHTTLLIFMPLLFVCTQIYLHRTRHLVHIKNILITVLIAIALYIPAIIHDIQNNIGNTQAFFQGTQIKTEENLNLVNRFTLTSQFFVQGNMYVLTGIEPRKDWHDVKKILHLKKYDEIVIAIISTIFFILGIVLLIKHLRKNESSSKKSFLLMTSSSIIITFCLFLLIAGELNLRFFIILIFLPFIFLGLIIRDFSNHYHQNSFTKIVIILIIALITSLNFISYKTAYDFSNINTKEEVYGGISIGELEKMTHFITMHAKEKNYLAPFAYEKSIKFFVRQNNINISNIKTDTISADSNIFLITKNKKHLNLPSDYAKCFEVIKEKRLQRFTIFLLHTTSTCIK